MTTSGVQPLGPERLDTLQGENKTFLLTVLDEERNPANLTGATITFTVRKDFDTAAVITKTSATPGEIDILAPPTDGLAKIFLVPADTSGLAPGQYIYDVWVELSGGEKINVITPSRFIIGQGVTAP